MNPFDFPLALDNTILSSFRTCETLARLQYLLHWKSKYESPHLLAGSAFASGLEHMRNSFFIRGESKETALAKGVIAATKAYGWADHSDTKKSWEHVLAALDYSYKTFPLEQERYKPFVLDGQSTVEYSFAMPLPIMHPQTGEPLIYAGRADQLVKAPNGDVLLEDDKTTSQLGISFQSKWAMRSQFMGYMYQAKRYGGLDVRGVLIRGICFYKDKIDHQEVIEYYTDFILDEWYRVTLETIQRLIKVWQTGVSLLDLGDACEAYGGCPFKNICKSPNPETWLPVDFRQKIWDPVNREEIVL